MKVDIDAIAEKAGLELNSEVVKLDTMREFFAESDKCPCNPGKKCPCSDFGAVVSGAMPMCGCMLFRRPVNV
jgi:hypothetical protein